MASAASSADIVGQVMSIHSLRNQVLGQPVEGFRRRFVPGAGTSLLLSCSKRRLVGLGGDCALSDCFRTPAPALDDVCGRSEEESTCLGDAAVDASLVSDASSWRVGGGLDSDGSKHEQY